MLKSTVCNLYCKVTINKIKSPIQATRQMNKCMLQLWKFSNSLGHEGSM
jgi:hypothetical protein